MTPFNKDRVDIEYVRQLIEHIGELNRIPFGDINWYKNGEPMNLSDEQKETWKFTGLSNKCFADPTLNITQLF